MSDLLPDQVPGDPQPLRWYRDNLPKLLAEHEQEGELPRWAQDRLAVLRCALRAEAESRRASAGLRVLWDHPGGRLP